MSWNLAASVLDAASFFISDLSGRRIVVVHLSHTQHTLSPLTYRSSLQQLITNTLQIIPQTELFIGTLHIMSASPLSVFQSRLKTHLVMNCCL